MEAFTPLFKKQQFQRKQIVYHFGQEPAALYIVDSGQLGLVLEESIGTKVIETLLPGTMVGELEMFSGKPRISNLVSLTETTVWSLAKNDYDKFAVLNPGLALRFVSEICLPFDSVRFYNTVHHWSQLR